VPEVHATRWWDQPHVEVEGPVLTE